ncbi:ribosome maturation factor RimM [Campylobacter canadensis]|uniref:Ribosome maturation factor RimM n=1 Tax=Campylobacter canadensis TaxID=449520 RepID=A0ABS7WRW4_9BACT|nr:ribosome maturation factor RimM [Campylobacter canadensis]MBZ7987491.1 16S rRNA processing protein RimM [Campylobacter canadensis]MBZ7994834.1 16S rRNA processing protein RimM [Campylobacter canadensis]MBZ7996381.1 16S rRNA processing protein RimM [Campylobacter canadensis]MBZ7998415.1 16S rRNA processing protein RimM [Campylobacter canadensis]MBZ8000129.1 16S rRNA processing protein RimM [Campylobacter canadensis]
MDNLVFVAKIGKTHGLLGYLKLHNKSDFYEQFKANKIFYNNKAEKFIIKHFDSVNSLVQFVGYEDINSAKNLVNMQLYSTIEDSRKLKLKKDEFFYFDIIGKEIIENSESLGIVTDILEVGSTYLFLVNTNSNLEGLAKEFYIPYNDNFIDKIDDKIYVKNSKMLLESL